MNEDLRGKEILLAAFVYDELPRAVWMIYKERVLHVFRDGRLLVEERLLELREEGTRWARIEHEDAFHVAIALRNSTP